MKRIASLLLATVFCAVTARAQQLSVTYEGKDGPGKGKHIVFIAGDEEYRSEEGLPMLAKILSQRHGFTSTVLFSVDKDGNIDSNANDSITDPEKLDAADAIVMLIRFRKWNDAAMKHFSDAVQRGVPIIALRTATHAFNLPKESAYAEWTWNNKEGGFGKMILGETWVSHWGKHRAQATRGVIEPSSSSNPVLSGVSDIFVTTDVYEAHPPDDSTILLRGQVLKGMNHDDEPADDRKPAQNKVEQAVNDPMMAIAWTREVKNAAGKTNKILCTTMGAATDLTNEGLRRLLVNGVFWGLGLQVPAKADVTYIGEYHPTMYGTKDSTDLNDPHGFRGFKHGVKPSDLK